MNENDTVCVAFHESSKLENHRNPETVP